MQNLPKLAIFIVLRSRHFGRQGVSLLTNSIADNLAQLLERISRSAQRAGRNPGQIGVIAVTKTLSAQAVRKAYALGLRDFGENRVQELIEKYEKGSLLSDFPDIRLHLIGHLQSNKVRKAVQSCCSIDTVDSLETAKAISSEAQRLDQQMRVLLEVNSSGEPQKFGVSFGMALPLAEQVGRLPNVTLAGLMTVGPLTEDTARIRSAFASTHATFERIGAQLKLPAWSVLSMGMSGDFEMAIEEGATEIRLGTILFGPRQ